MEIFGLEVNQSMTNGEVESRFGYHRHSERTGPIHGEVRAEFIKFALWLDEVIPKGRAKSVMFTELETAEAWATKAISELDPVAK